MRPCLGRFAFALSLAAIIPAYAADSIVPPGGVTRMVVSSGTTVDLRAGVVDGAGNPLAGRAVVVTPCSGNLFPHMYQYDVFTSDEHGMVTARWVAPHRNGSCPVEFGFQDESGAPLTIPVDLVGPVGFALRRESPRSQTVPFDSESADLRVSVVDASGVGVPGQGLKAYGPCGTFENETDDIARVYTDSAGVATLRWRAPSASSGFLYCNLNAEDQQGKLYAEPASGGFWVVDFLITLEPAPPPPPAAAASVAYGAGSAASITVPAGAWLGYGGPMPFLMSTLDAAGQITGGLTFNLSTTCGSLNGNSATLALTSPYLPSFGLPPWLAPSTPGTCVIRAYSGNSAIEWTVNVAAPAASPGIAYLDDLRSFSVAPGQSLAGLQLATVDGAGRRVPNIPVAISSTCGVFDGGFVGASWSSDSAGLIVFPAWFAPSMPTSCTLSAALFTNPEARVGFVVNVALNGGPEPPAGSAPPITARAADSPAGGAINLLLGAGSGSCTLADLIVLNPSVTEFFNFPPSQLSSSRHGYISFGVEGCTPGQAVTFTVEFPEDLPPTSQWWKFGASPDNRAGHWHVVPSTVNGKRITFTITDGGLGDDDLMANGTTRVFGILGIPGGPMQDLWWSGEAENGWGMTLVQHRDVLFGNFFVYDAQGRPTWYVMPSGTFNDTRTVYTGGLYLPKGSPFFAYDATKFDIGAAVGSATITFTGVDEAIFEYTIDGISGRKSISRLAFGPVEAPTDKPLGDLWWAGIAQNGWGLAVMQQHASLFALWFTYDANGRPTWYVMPGGSWAAKDDYRGTVFRPEGPAWLGVPYDASRHRTIEAGTFRLRFGDAPSFDYTVDGKSGSVPLSRIPF